MAKYASAYVSLILSWKGRNEADGTHRMIVDLYNSKVPRARGYKVTYRDAWCAATTSAAAIKLGYTDIIPIECSCYYLIEKAKKMNIWVEDDAHIPSLGELCLYDWDDNGVGDNKGNPEHVGAVTEVNIEAGTFVVTEGNYSDRVKDRTLKINGKYIRGFICPKYDKELSAEPTVSQVKVDYAKKYDKAYSGEYEVTTDLYLRCGAGTLKKSIVVMPKGSKVKCYGYYTNVLGVTWLLVQYGKTTGFCSLRKLKK